ncbi:30S ribosomal protein S4 [bacterium]|nr:30S ribosomal protein S4 [bacterium]
MARYKGPLCRLCRREGEKLFLKGDRCFKDKCSLEKKGYPPGEHGQRRQKVSDYGMQLREKQKVKRMYGILEKQFRGYFMKLERQKGITGENLLIRIESRLDNMVYRFGFAISRNQARVLVSQGHFLVNGKRVNIPSYILKPSNVVEVREKSRKISVIKESMESAAQRGIPAWLELDVENFRGTVKALPTREEITHPIHEQMIVELYSK